MRLFPFVALAFTRVPSCVQHLVDAYGRSTHAVSVETALSPVISDSVFFFPCGDTCSR